MFRSVRCIVLSCLLPTLLLGCGSKENSDDRAPAPSGSGDQTAGENGPKGDKGERGDKGEKGDRGDAGPKGDAGAGGANLSYRVKDANGQTLGATDFSNYHAFLYGTEAFFQLSDGVVMKLNLQTGRSSGQFCFYASNDCTGTCLYPTKSGERNKVVEGVAGLYKVNGGEVSASMMYQSYAVADTPSPSCTVLGAPSSATLSALPAAYTPPGGLTYPFVAPINIEAP